MSFVQLVTVLALLAVTLGGLYGGIAAFVRRRVEYPPYVVQGWGAVTLGVVYLLGGLVGLMVLALMLLNRSS